MIVQNLVGIAMIGSIMHDAFLVEWIRSPTSPNLYWALAEVPTYVGWRKTISGDLRFPEYTLPLLKEIDSRPFTADEATELATRAFSTASQLFGGSFEDQELTRRAALAAWALQAYGASYRELAAAGFSEELLGKMPVLQVALLGRWKRYQVLRDDLYKWSAIAYGPNRELALRKLDEIRSESRQTTVPFDAFLPALRAMYQAQLRQHRFLSVLRAIEALRIHAARHGKWPETLADVTEVPVPNDPVTNSPFVYSKSGNNATLIMVEHRLGSGIEYEYHLRLREANDIKR
jgi:hypothetical protein